MQVKFSDGKRDAVVAGKYISSTEITCNTPSFEKFGPMDVVVRVAIKGDLTLTLTLSQTLSLSPRLSPSLRPNPSPQP